MSIGIVFMIVTLVVVLVISVLSIVVSTTKGATWGQSLWDDKADESHTRHARHQRDHEIRAADGRSRAAGPGPPRPDPTR